MLQKCRLNIDAAEYEQNIDDNLYKTSEKENLHRVDSGDYWPKLIKEIIQWFPFLTVMEHTANITEKNNELISSLLKVFAMFEILLSYKKGILDVLFLKYINFKRVTCLYEKINSWVFDEVITKFLLNAILHHVGMSWIISSNQEMEYEMDENNHQDWLNKGPWYNTSICSKLHGSRFEDFITQARTYRYNLMCYLVAHDKLKPYYKYYERSIGDRSIPDNATPK